MKALFPPASLQHEKLRVRVIFASLFTSSGENRARETAGKALRKLPFTQLDLAGAATQNLCKSLESQSEEKNLPPAENVPSALRGAEQSGLSPQPHHQHSTATPNEGIRNVVYLTPCAPVDPKDRDADIGVVFWCRKAWHSLPPTQPNDRNADIGVMFWCRKGWHPLPPTQQPLP